MANPIFPNTNNLIKIAAIVGGILFVLAAITIMTLLGISTF